ncbi:exo-beta-N-acetylmuramidase NamZ domain-containing protein [Paenibacillus yanchengensis]|uniref:Exo-beta-N-acetylmuramidase NamZ domain-containing protein n=1 Tax=Paenibacillus yanchengensis TaxID=2035833 RepID=A0ABW4YFW4_9BACL
MVLNGVDSFSKFRHLFAGKRVGLITAPTGLTKQLRSTIDVVQEHCQLVAMFSPEHGVRGDLDAGDLVDTYIDPYTNVPVYSLYRKDSKRLTEEMLRKVDIVIYDIQDVGVRYYTFIYTMLYALEDCAKAGVEFVVLDRVNPLDGITVQGNILQASYRSFVGNYELAVRYGLTAGEVAMMANDQMNWQAKLHIVPITGWQRAMAFPETGLTWVHPSLGIPRYETALLYVGTCLFEGTNCSEGRGTTFPFELIGAPYIQAEQLAQQMNDKGLEGIFFRPVYFKPNMSKHAGELCGGVQLYITNHATIRPLDVAVTLLFMIRDLYEQFSFLPPIKAGSRPFIDLLGGSDVYRQPHQTATTLLEQFAEDSKQFAVMKKAYHLYR